MILRVYLNSCNTFLWQIDKEREGEQIDRALLKNVLGIFVEIGLGSMECYENDFEDFLLKDTTDYYSLKAQSWILEDSCPDYMIKVHLRRIFWLVLSVFVNDISGVINGCCFC